MSDQLTASLPQESDGQRIGRQATQSFHANVPISWKVDSTDGDNDCGYDFQIQLVEQSLVKDIFRAQLKGETTPKLNATGTAFSVSLEMSTVNYYARAIEPILLVLCDLSSAEHPKNCRLYYCWIHDEIRRIRDAGVREDQGSVTFHVPAANNLDEKTNLSDDVERFRRLSRIGDQLDTIVERQRPELSVGERVALAAKLTPNLINRSSDLLNSLTDNSPTSWVDAPEGSLQWDLQEARTALRSGSIVRCQSLLDHAFSLLDGAKALEQADYWHVLGRLRAFRLDDEGSNTAFERACVLSNDAETHLVPWAESELRIQVRDSGGPTDFSAVKIRLTSNDPLIVATKARLTAAEGKYQEALSIAERIDGIDGYTAQAIIFTMQAKWREAIDACEKGLATTLTLKDNARFLLVVTRARARFSLALELGASDGEEIVLPVNGPACTDTALLRAAWDDISEAATMLRSRGWPGNVECISDIWPHTAIMLGLHKEALPILAEAGDVHPSLAILQAGVELLAARSGDFRLALKANDRQPESDRRLLRRISLLHLANRHGDCVDLMLSKGERATSDIPMLGHAVSLAIFSAEKLVRSDLVSRWTHILDSNPELAAIFSIHQYLSTKSNNVLAKRSGLDKLEDEYERLGQPLLITKLLFQELDPTIQEHAKKLLLLAERLTKDQLLDVDQCLLLAQALTTLNKWEELLRLSDDASARFQNSDRLVAVGALALDKLGRSSEAHSRLQALIQKDSPDPLALGAYINIAAISGFTSEAIECLENVLANETDDRRKLGCLSNLFRLVHVSDPDSPRLIEIAWRIGQTVQQENESEEGMFLHSIFSATLHAGASLSEERDAAFRQRLDTFAEKFPNSKILRRFSVSEKPSVDELLRTLADAIGMEKDKTRWREKLQNELNRGLVPIPYAWRPRHVLDGIPDLLALWEISKSSRWEQLQFHLTMAVSEWTPVSFTHIKTRVPLLDLTALMVVHDLGIFDTLFELFPKIAIGKATLLELQDLLSPWSNTPYRAKCECLMSALRDRFEQIEQPNADPPEDDGFARAKWASQEVIEIAKVNSRYLIYSDDAFFRIYASEGNSGTLSICTLDVLKAADDMGILSPKKVAQYIARLCSWRVGLIIQARHQLAIIPDELGSARNVTDGIEILRSSEPCNAMFSGLWHPNKPFPQLVGHIGSLLRDLSEDATNALDSVTALGGFWASKVKLYRNSPSPPSRLIALAVAQAIVIDKPINQITSQRLWSVFRKLIEVTHGPQMDDQIYDESIATIAGIAIEIDQSQALKHDHSVAQRLRLGLTQGTSDYDKFSNALGRAMTSLATRHP
jgi:tetratricopeptide (TPR) repeat protein